MGDQSGTVSSVGFFLLSIPFIFSRLCTPPDSAIYFRPRTALEHFKSTHLPTFYHNSSTLFCRFCSKTHSTQLYLSHQTVNKCTCAAYLTSFALNAASISVWCMLHIQRVCSNCIVMMRQWPWGKYCQPKSCQLNTIPALQTGCEHG